MGNRVVIGCSMLAGVLLGFGMMGDYTHFMWPLLAGLAIGVTGALTARSHPVFLSLLGGNIAVMASVITIVSLQHLRGRWPITDEWTIQHYGTTESAILKCGITLFVLILVPCFMAALIVVLARRQVTQRSIAACNGRNIQ